MDSPVEHDSAGSRWQGQNETFYYKVGELVRISHRRRLFWDVKALDNDPRKMLATFNQNKA